jgi:hypothetical protein
MRIPGVQLVGTGADDRCEFAFDAAETKGYSSRPPSEPSVADCLKFLAGSHGHLSGLLSETAAVVMAAMVAIVVEQVNDAEFGAWRAFTPPLDRFFTVDRPSPAAWLSIKTSLHDLHLCGGNEAYRQRPSSQYVRN